MKKINSIFAILFAFCSHTVYAQNFEWAKRVGNNRGNQGVAIVTDKDGNTYSIGELPGGPAVDFDPGPGVSNLTSTGEKDVYILKLNPAGDFVWAKSFGGPNNDEYGNAMAIDTLGNLYITGNFRGTADFDPGTGTYNLTANGAEDVYVLKLNANGELVWARNMGGSKGNSNYGRSIAIDAAGNVYTTGYFSDTADFDPGTNTHNLISNGAAQDIYISKLDNLGNFVWAKSIGGTGSDQSQAITVDNSGNIYVTGQYTDTVDFDPGTGTFNVSSNLNNYDLFILKLNSSGDFQWVKTIGGTDNETGYAIITDASGNIYISGEFGGTVDFDPGSGTQNLVGGAGVERDLFLLKLDISGNFIWAKNIDAYFGFPSNALTLDTSANLYLTGAFWGTVDFDPGPLNYALTAVGGGDIFVAKFDSSGSFGWAVGFGGSTTDRGYGIAVDNASNVYTTGFFVNTVDFDPGPGVENLTSAGNYDIFIHKMSQEVCNGQPTYDTLTVTACDSFQFLGQTYTTNGYYSHSFISSNFCDSIVTLDLTVNYSSDTLLSITTCDSFSFNDVTYSASGIYTDTIQTVTGCDSIITFNLTIKHSNSGLLTHTACDSFTLEGQTYTQSGTYKQTLTNISDCDSILTIDLTVVHINTDVTQRGDTLTADETGATYRWIDCDNNNAPVVGGNQQSFSPSITGSYAVVITKNECRDTSDCYTVEIAGNDINKLVKGNTIQLYPNPTGDIIYISSPISVNTLLLSIEGREIDRYNNVREISLNKLAKGIYLLYLTDQNGNLVKREKVIKN